MRGRRSSGPRSRPSSEPTVLAPSEVADRRAVAGMGSPLPARRPATRSRPAAATLATSGRAVRRGAQPSASAWRHAVGRGRGACAGWPSPTARVASGDAVLVAGRPWPPQLVDATGLPGRRSRRTWGVTVQLGPGPGPPRARDRGGQVDAVTGRTPSSTRHGGRGGGSGEPCSAWPPPWASVATVGSTFLTGARPIPRSRAGSWSPVAPHIVPAIAEARIREIRMPAPGPVGGRSSAHRAGRGSRPGLFVCAGHRPWGISIGPGRADSPRT